MRLTNNIRDAFIRAAIQDVPWVDYEEIIREKASEFYIAKLPAKVKKIYDDVNLRDYVAQNYIYEFGVSLCVPGAGNNLTDEEKKELQSLELEYDAQCAKHDELWSKLRAAAYSCTTRKQLAELLPEFEKYLPSR